MVKIKWLIILTVFFVQTVFAQLDDRSAKVIRGVNYIGVSVTDIERASEFYSGPANLQTVSKNMIEGGSVLDDIAGRPALTAKTNLLRSSNAQLRLMEFSSHSSEALASTPVEVHGPGIAHVCFQVAGTTESYQKFLQAGAVPIGAIEMVQLNPRNPVVYAYARDHDGAVIEVEHIDFEKLARPRSNDYRIRHVSLASPDIERMVAFYSVLMEEPEPRRLGRGGTLSGENFDKVSGHSGTKMEMAWFQVRNLELEIVQYHSHPTELPVQPRPLDAPGFNMVVFDVTDLDAARQLLIKAGGSFVGESESLAEGQLFYGRDPDLNLLGFQLVPNAHPLSSQNFPDNGI